MQRLRREGPHMAEMLPELASQAIKSLERGEGLGVGKKTIAQMRQELQRNNRQQMRATVGAALLVGATVIAVAGSAHFPALLGMAWPAWLMGSAGAWLAWKALADQD